MTTRHDAGEGRARGSSVGSSSTGLRVLILYKAVRGGGALVLGIALAIAAIRGADARLREWAIALSEHATHAWAIRLADAVVRTASPRALELGAAALLCDGAFTSFEGFALYRGYRFAPWLVIVATAAFLPLEIYEMAERFRAGKALLFVANAAVLVYLTRRTLRERRGASAIDGAWPK
ncbi:MAG: DUF2127 domain-containing protein [Polyangiaceae bacterium]